MASGGARRGRRDNGLTAAVYAVAGDVDPRVGEHLLDVLALRGIAAYLQPTADLHPVTRTTTLPSRPIDRLYVDREHLGTARAYLAQLAEQTPAEPDDQDEIDQAFAGIVATFDSRVDPGDAPWPAVENVTEPRRRRTDREPTGDGPDRPGRGAGRTDGRDRPGERGPREPGRSGGAGRAADADEPTGPGGDPSPGSGGAGPGGRAGDDPGERTRRPRPFGGFFDDGTGPSYLGDGTTARFTGDGTGPTMGGPGYDATAAPPADAGTPRSGAAGDDPDGPGEGTGGGDPKARLQREGATDRAGDSPGAHTRDGTEPDDRWHTGVAWEDDLTRLDEPGTTGRRGREQRWGRRASDRAGRDERGPGDQDQEPSLLDGLDTLGADLPDEEEEGYTPPPPPPLPRLSPVTIAAVIALFAGFVLIFKPELLPVGYTSAMTVGFLGILGGFVALVWRLRSGDDDEDDDPDDGAVV